MMTKKKKVLKMFIFGSLKKIFPLFVICLPKQFTEANLVPCLQICVWNSDGWEKQRNRFLQIPPGRTPSVLSDTRVQFHQDQIHFLVVHETQLAIYEANKLEYVKQQVFYVAVSSVRIIHCWICLLLSCLLKD